MVILSSNSRLFSTAKPLHPFGGRGLRLWLCGQPNSAQPSTNDNTPPLRRRRRMPLRISPRAVPAYFTTQSIRAQGVNAHTSLETQRINPHSAQTRGVNPHSVQTPSINMENAKNAPNAHNGANHAAPASSWAGHQGAAAFDLRSDTMTTPTLAMLNAIQSATLLDDVFEEDTTTKELEAHVAALAGKEAGLFVLSGTMGNQIALRSLLTQPPHSVLCDHRSHILRYEAGGVASLCGAFTHPVLPSNGRYLTLEDVKGNVVLSDDVHACPTRVISLENSLNGMVMPLEEAQRISAFAREHGILMHCDGARLWEVVAAGAGSLADFCACFDTISLCFSKGLGAPIGSIVVGTKPLIKHGRWVRKSIGGGLRQSGVVAAAARVAVDVTFGKDSNGRDGLLSASHVTAQRVEKMWTELGGRMAHPVETNMCWLDLASLGCTAARFEALGREEGLRLMGPRLITHYQIGEEAIQKLASVFQQVAQESAAGVEPVKTQPVGIYGQ